MAFRERGETFRSSSHPSPSDSAALSKRVDSKPSEASNSYRTASLFPLELSPLEKFFYVDDSPDCPLTSFVELHFDGPLKLAVLRSSLQTAVKRHPLLACRICEVGKTLTWQHDPDFCPAIHDASQYPVLEAADGSFAPIPRVRPIDLTQEPGCRVWYQAGFEGNRSRLIFQLHHATCDGVGLRQVIIDVLKGYRDATKDDGQGLRESVVPASETSFRIRRRNRHVQSTLRPEQLRERFRYRRFEESPAKIELSGWQRNRLAYYFHFQRPASLQTFARVSRKGPSDSKKGVEPISENDTLNDPMIHLELGASITANLQAFCRSRGIALNDVLLSALFRTCRRVHRQNGRTNRKTRMRLLMPVDLRYREDFYTPATNRLSFSFLGRTHEQCEDREALLSSVHEEVRWIKDTRVYMDFLAGLSLLAKRVQWLKWATRCSRNMATSVITYSGDVSRGLKHHLPETDGKRDVGDALLENIFLVPPTRDHTNVTLGACINGGRLCVSANWNRNAWDRSACESFLAMYAEELEKWVET